VARRDVVAFPPAVARLTTFGRSLDLVRVGYAAVAATVVLWGVGALFVRGIHMPALSVVMYRNWVSLPLVYVLVKVSGAHITRQALVATIPAGIAFTAAQVLGFASFKETSVANAALIGSLAPVVVVFAAAWLYGEQWRPIQAVYAVSALAGAVVVVLGSASGNGAARLGDLLAVGALLALAVYFLLIKRVRMGGLHPSVFLFGMFLVSALIATPLALLAGDDVSVPSAHDWVLIGCLVVFSGCAGHGLMMWAQKHVRLGTASIMTLGTSVVATAGGWAVYNQHLTVVQLLGALLLLASVAMLLRVQVVTPRDAA
jgi:drug/metabolite transporter (DMT)-like permease